MRFAVARGGGLIAGAAVGFCLIPVGVCCRIVNKGLDVVRLGRVLAPIKAGECVKARELGAITGQSWTYAAVDDGDGAGKWNVATPVITGNSGALNVVA